MNGMELIEQELKRLAEPLIGQLVGDVLGGIHNRLARVERHAGLPAVSPPAPVNPASKSAAPALPTTKQSWEK